MSAAEKWNGNTSGGEKPRLKDDQYFTPDTLALATCRKLSTAIGAPDLVVEPSAGTGAYVRAARSTWPDAHIIAVDRHATINALAVPGDGEVRETTWEDGNAAPRMRDRGAAPETRRILIVGNPPFSLAEEHVTIALDRVGHKMEIVPRPRFVSFLLRASFLATQDRVDSLHLALGGLRYVWHLRERPGFTPDGRADSAEYCVCTWQAGYRGPYEGSWLSWR